MSLSSPAAAAKEPRVSSFNIKCSETTWLFSELSRLWARLLLPALLGAHFGVTIAEEIRSWWAAKRNELSLTSAKAGARPSVCGYAANGELGKTRNEQMFSGLPQIADADAMNAILKLLQTHRSSLRRLQIKRR
jgi:hypothetical protein